MEATDTAMGLREKMLWRMLRETAAHAEEILTLDSGDLDTAIRRPRMRSKGGGRRRHGEREVLAAIIFVAASGCTWAQLPPVFGPSGPTAHRRFTEWSRVRVWAKLHRLVLDELGSRGVVD